MHKQSHTHTSPASPAGWDPEGILGLDLKKAYGLAYRSSMLRGVRQSAPPLSALLGAEWRLRRTVVWQRVIVASTGRATWRRSFAHRGGW